MLLQMVQSQKNRPVRIIAALNVDALVGIFVFFGTCRICLREMFRKGEVPGVKKSSW
jgi:ribosomal protein S14